MALDMRVRVAWVSDPFDPAPTWTDVSSFVDVGSRSIDITRGSGDLDDSVNPSTLSLTFNNKDGRFTPGYASGAYYPNVVLGKRIQVHSTTNGSVFTPRFDGYIDTLPMQWAPSGRYAEAAVTAVDRIKKLSKQLTVTDLIGTYIGTPSDYWKFGDADGVIHPLNSAAAPVTTLTGYVNAAAHPGTIAFGQATGPGTDGLTAVQITNSQFLGQAGTYPYSVSGSDSLALGCFFRIAAPNQLSSAVLVQFGDDDLIFGDIGVDLFTGQLFAEFSQDVNYNFCESTARVVDGLTHHALCVWARSGTNVNMTLYLDGASVATATVTAVPGAIGNVRIRSVGQTGAGGLSDVGVGVFAHVAVYTTANIPSGTAVADMSNAGLNGFSGETSAARFTRICGLVPVTPIVTGTPGTRAMGPLTGFQGASILDLLQAVQDTENGAMFTQTDGDLQLVPRTAFYNQAAAMTLTNGQYGIDLTFLLDDSRLVNDAAVTDGNGIAQRVQNSTSITANGTYSVQKTVATSSTAEALSWAQWQVYAAGVLSARVSQVTLDLLTQQSLLATAWTLDVGNRLDLSSLPTGAPAATVSLQIAGYTESYSLTNYTMTFNTIPNLTANLFIFNDATLGRFNTGGVLAY